jgi:hypothetical protein
VTPTASRYPADLTDCPPEAETSGTENLIRDAVRGGMKPLAAYEQFGKF